MTLTLQDAVQILVVINAVAAFIAVIGICVSGRRDLPNRLACILSLLFSAWSACLYLALKEQAVEVSAYYYRMSFVPLVFFTPVFLHLLSIYSDRKTFTQNIIMKLYIVFFLIFAAYFVMPQAFIKGALKGVYLRNIIEPGFGFHVFVLIFLCFAFCGSYYLIHADKMYLKLKQHRRIWLFIALGIGMLAPINIFLTSYGLQFIPLGLLGVMPFAFLLWYAITRSHTLEANIVINKTVLLAYFTFFIILIYTGFVHLLVRFAQIQYYNSSILAGCAVLLCLLFGVHYGGLSRLEGAADRLVYEKRMKYYEFLSAIHARQQDGSELDVLLNDGVDALVSLVGIECCSVYLLDENTMDYALRAYRGIDKEKAFLLQRIPVSNRLVEFLKKNNIFVDGENEEFSSLKEANTVKEEFGKVNMKLSVPVYYSTPVYSKKEIFGFLNLGNKKNNASYTPEDIDILNAYARELGASVDKFRFMMSAIQDDLTKLYRRNYFLKRLEEEAERSKRYERPFSLVMIDVDDFKRVNDTKGHQAGDELLRQISFVIKNGLRRTDIAARYGGEEFVILMPETDKIQGAAAGERLRKTVEKEFKGSVTISIGLATYDKFSAQTDIIRQADIALYQAKAQGKNRTVSA